MEFDKGQQMINEVLDKKAAFLSVFFVVFLISYALLAWADFLPEPVSKIDESQKEEQIKITDPENNNELKANTNTGKADNIDDFQPEGPVIKEQTLPTMLVIDSLNKTVPVLNPSSRKVSDLDEALLDGIVRHPDSATLEQTGTVFILGHSSYLPFVNNGNFQALNGIQDLKWGDIVRLQSGEYEYVYQVDKVYKAKAQDTTVPIASETQRLVLATCNSFGSIDDRYMVEAELFEVRTL